MSFKEAMVCASTNVPLYFSTPDWVPGISEKLRRVRVAFDELEVRTEYYHRPGCESTFIDCGQKYMSEMVRERRLAAGSFERCDVLTRLLEENDQDASAMDMRGILCECRHDMSQTAKLKAHISSPYLRHPDSRSRGKHPSFSFNVSSLSDIQTLAHTICFALALLALHPEEQEKLYEHIKRVYPKDGRLPVSDWPDPGPNALTRAEIWRYD